MHRLVATTVLAYGRHHLLGGSFAVRWASVALGSAVVFTLAPLSYRCLEGPLRNRLGQSLIAVRHLRPSSFH